MEEKRKERKSNIIRSSSSWRRRGWIELATLAGVAAAGGEEEGEN